MLLTREILQKRAMVSFPFKNVTSSLKRRASCHQTLLYASLLSNQTKSPLPMTIRTLLVICTNVPFYNVEHCPAMELFRAIMGSPNFDLVVFP